MAMVFQAILDEIIKMKQEAFHFYKLSPLVLCHEKLNKQISKYLLLKSIIYVHVKSFANYANLNEVLNWKIHIIITNFCSHKHNFVNTN